MSIFTSQNGWPVLLLPIQTTKTEVCGREWRFANDDVAYIATKFIEWYNVAIEPIIEPGETPDDWSWFVRPIRGQSSGYSNHASATAWDINSTRHPRGVPASRNLSDKQIAEIEFALSHVFHDAIRWGGTYVHAPTDAMHYEINCPPIELHSIVTQMKSEETDMALDLTTPITITPAMADAMNSIGEIAHAGQTMTLGNFIAWGNARDAQNQALLVGLGKRLDAVLTNTASLITQGNLHNQDLLDIRSAVIPTAPKSPSTPE